MSKSKDFDTDYYPSVRPIRYNKGLRLLETNEEQVGKKDLEETHTSKEAFKATASTTCTSTDESFALEDTVQNQEDTLPFICDDSSDNCVSDDADGGTTSSKTSAENNKHSEVSIEKLLSDVLFHHKLDEHDEFESTLNDDLENCNDCDDTYCDEDEETESTEFDKEELVISEDDPIYHGHAMPVRVSLLLILIYSITNSISESQLKDLLTLIGLHCMEVHPGLKSLFHFKQYFASVKSPLRKHYYCVHCLMCVESNLSKCPNKLCLMDISDSKAKSYFIEVPLENQIQNLFRRENFPELLMHRFKRNTTNNTTIEDMYDGEMYNKMSVDGGPLSQSNPYNLSFTLNTDGIPIFKSSKFSIWPIYLMVNELPFKIRKQSENMIFCGLWFGDMKPFMATFSRNFLFLLCILVLRIWRKMASVYRSTMRIRSAKPSCYVLLQTFQQEVYC